MKNWLRKANGWQRIWFVITSIGLFLSIFILPFVLSWDINIGERREQRKIINQIQTPECLPYTIKPMKELKPIKATGSDYEACGSIYYFRKLSDYPNNTPITAEKVNKAIVEKMWKNIFAYLAILLSLTIITSVLVYGLVKYSNIFIKWIYKGFKEN